MEGNGLRGMRERVEMLGGTLERTNRSGTMLIISLPLKETISRERSSKERLSKEDLSAERSSHEVALADEGRSH